MKPSEKELKCIVYSRSKYPPRFKKRTLSQILLFQKPRLIPSEFEVNKCYTDEEKSLRILWAMYGLNWSSSMYDIHGNYKERILSNDDIVLKKYGEGSVSEFENTFFQTEDIIDCIDFWIKTLYEKEIDLTSFIEENKIIIQQSNKNIKEVSFRTNSPKRKVNFGSLTDRLINQLSKSLGNYYP